MGITEEQKLKEDLKKAVLVIADLNEKLDISPNAKNQAEIEKELKNKNESLEKAGNVIQELKKKIINGLGKETQEHIENLEKELEVKNNKIVELAESVAKTQPPPRRVKTDVKYSNKYTESQIKAFKKNEISTENLDTEPEPADS